MCKVGILWYAFKVGNTLRYQLYNVNCLQREVDDEEEKGFWVDGWIETVEKLHWIIMM